eukprot:TRINITY_DN75455_c0_g1_i1.p1 TRINITY_DN75455_c0_g1~~TRINITY_DN75455_c0_g1_i1.p1  ORF type:complete len:781 (+),score=128.69 TRINITY_DN75455_c0_g1_i1:85-2343(+)
MNSPTSTRSFDCGQMFSQTPRTTVQMGGVSPVPLAFSPNQTKTPTKQTTATPTKHLVKTPPRVPKTTINLRQSGRTAVRGSSPIKAPSLSLLRTNPNAPERSELQVPVACKLVERDGSQHFSCGSVSMTGHRANMEDAHAVRCESNWGFFGVFDGHNGANCASFCSRAFPPAIAAATPPLSAEKIEEITLDIDAQYNKGNPPGGSTAALVIASLTEPNKYHVQVSHVGDSRVLVANRTTGNIKYSTVDHKPNLVRERMRIEKYGGVVKNGRVDGRLAMSRAMGDPEFKVGRPNPLERRLTAQPDTAVMDCSTDDIVIVACDGIFENEFSDEQVVAFVIKQLQTTPDLGKVVARLCDESLRRGSSDNLTAMVVQFKDGTATRGMKEFVPGPFFPRANQDKFKKAYETMVAKAGLSWENAMELRYRQLCDEIGTNILAPTGMASVEPSCEKADLVAELKELREERPNRAYDDLKDNITRRVKELLTPEKFDLMCEHLSTQVTGLIVEMQQHEGQRTPQRTPPNSQPPSQAPTQLRRQSTGSFNFGNMNLNNIQLQLDPRIDLSIPNPFPQSSFEQNMWQTQQQQAPGQMPQQMMAPTMQAPTVQAPTIQAPTMQMHPQTPRSQVTVQQPQRSQSTVARRSSGQFSFPPFNGQPQQATSNQVIPTTLSTPNCNVNNILMQITGQTSHSTAPQHLMKSNSVPTMQNFPNYFNTAGGAGQPMRHMSGSGATITNCNQPAVFAAPRRQSSGAAFFNSM